MLVTSAPAPGDAAGEALARSLGSPVALGEPDAPAAEAPSGTASTSGEGFVVLRSCSARRSLTRGSGGSSAWGGAGRLGYPDVRHPGLVELVGDRDAVGGAHQRAPGQAVGVGPRRPDQSTPIPAEGRDRGGRPRLRRRRGSGRRRHRPGGVARGVGSGPATPALGGSSTGATSARAPPGPRPRAPAVASAARADPSLPPRSHRRKQATTGSLVEQRLRTLNASRIDFYGLSGQGGFLTDRTRRRLADGVNEHNIAGDAEHQDPIVVQIFDDSTQRRSLILNLKCGSRACAERDLPPTNLISHLNFHVQHDARLLRRISSPACDVVPGFSSNQDSVALAKRGLQQGDEHHHAPLGKGTYNTTLSTKHVLAACPKRHASLR